MKKVFTLVTFVLTSLLGFAQLNDDCATIIDLGDAPNCDETTFYTNVGATPSNIGTDNIPSCSNSGAMLRDVWFQFTAVDTILDYTVTVSGLPDLSGPTPTQPLMNPIVTVYRGDCEFDGLQELACLEVEPGETIAALDLLGLTPGIVYYIRVSDYSASATPNSGTFTLCVDEIDPVNFIDEGGSTSCFGQLFDSGGPDGDYGPNENFVYTICPSDFHECINFTLEFYNIENSSLDELTFYDGDGTGNPVLGQIGGGFGGTEAGGAVCYSVSASSGCLTVEFTSDGTTQFEGFAGSWECTTTPCEEVEVIEVTETATDDQILDAVSTQQTVVTIDTIICDPASYGTFTSTDPSFGLEQGLVLSSGRVANDPDAPFGGIGVNNPGNLFASTSISDFGVDSGDPDLDALSLASGNDNPSNDACVVEVDVFVATDQLQFEYIFGSEEYPEFVGTNFNDIFALLVSGPGIVGDPNINNQVNIATLPDGTPVQINGVNNEINWEYYRNNETGEHVVYDGLTSDFLGAKKSLTASIDVTPCETYHLKFAVADRGDRIYDSGVFISDIRAGRPELDVQFQNGIDYFVEECALQDDVIAIGLTTPQDEVTSFVVNVGGTATNGLDYTLTLPDSIIFQPGETEFLFPISILTDGIAEGVETVEITLTNNFGCGDVILETLVVEIRDALNVEINGGDPSVLVCADSSTVLTATGANDWFWQPPAIVDNPFGAEVVASPTQDITVTVIGTLGQCSDTDEIVLEIVSPEVTLETDDILEICAGHSITLTAINNVDDSELTFFPANLVSDPNAPTVQVFPTVDGQEITVSVSQAGCVATDTITIAVDQFEFPTLIADTTLCETFPISLAEGDFTTNTSTNYQWTPSVGLNSDTIPDPIALPDMTTTYTLIGTSEREFCADTASVTIGIIPASIDLNVGDTTFLCLGETAVIQANSSTAGVGLVFTPADQVTQIDAETVSTTPTESFWLFSTLTTPECTVLDSVFVRVDSLPDMPLSLIPDQESYCQGEQVTIVSPVYEPSDFPNIDHSWSPTFSTLTPDSLYNLVISADETTLYTRTTTNNACVQEDTITIVVVPTAIIETSPDTTICAGQETVLTAFLEGVDDDDYTWTPGDLEGASVTVAPGNTTTYSVEAEFDGCPVSGSVTVTVALPPQLGLAPDQTICPGDVVLLNTFEDPTVTYSWTSSDGTFTSNDPTPSVNPTVTTTYTLVASNDCGDTNASIIIQVPDDQLTVEGGGEYCESDLPITLTARVNTSGNTYLWSTGETTRQIELNDLSQAGTYSVTVTTACGTVIEGSTTVTISQNFELFLTAVPDTSTVFAGDEIVLTATTNPDLTNLEFLWRQDGTDLNQTGNPITVIAPDTGGDQPITVTYAVDVINGACEQTDAITFTVEPSSLNMPNVFFPTGSNVLEENRVFGPITQGNVDVETFRIYSRWGQLVFEGSNTNLFWDGTRNGTLAPQDVYVYIVEFRRGLGDTETLQGDVTLVR